MWGNKSNLKRWKSSGECLRSLSKVNRRKLNLQHDESFLTYLALLFFPTMQWVGWMKTPRGSDESFLIFLVRVCWGMSTMCYITKRCFTWWSWYACKMSLREKQVEITTLGEWSSYMLRYEKPWRFTEVIYSIVVAYLKPKISFAWNFHKGENFLFEILRKAACPLIDA